MWKPKEIPELKNGVWTTRTFTEKKEFEEFLLSQFKEPGKYNLKDTYLWRQPAISFDKNKRYCNFPEKSEEFKNYFAKEKKKIGQGVIINDFFVPGDYYWYLNFTPIVDKVKKREDFAEMWDGDYHYYLYGEIARHVSLNEAVVKARQKGFEQPNSEPVLTEHGFRPMGELKVGDRVYTKNGKLTEIVEVFPQGVKDVYEVELMDGRKIRCGINHLWEVVNKKSRGRRTEVLSLAQMLNKGITTKVFAPLKDGTKKEYKSYKFCIPEIKPIEYPEVSLPVPAYTLGVLLGDGSFRKKQCLVTTSDLELLDLVKEDLGGDYDFGKKYYSSEGCFRAAIVYKKRFDRSNNATKYENTEYGLNPITREIKAMGLETANCYNKFIPEVYKKASVKDRIALLQGLMDTDGFVSESGYDLNFTTTAEQLKDGVVEICRSLGLPVSFTSYAAREKNHHPFWRVYIGNKISLFRLGRKVSRQRLERERRTSVAIVNITKLDYQEESSCIQVADPSHIYITKDYVPTHNSLKIVSKLVRQLWFVRQSVSKMVGYEEDHINTNGSWKFANNYRSFLNEHTPWYRDFEPDGVLEWEQKKTVIQGLTNTKKTTKGLKSRLTGATTKKNPAKAVGGLITDLFCEEAGIAPNLDKVLEFAEAATKMGGVKTGHVIVSGAVGELKDCAPLEAIAFAPEKNGFLGVTDIFSEVPHDEKICFFFPDYWNYLAIDEEGNPVKCYDEDGNSDIELAKEYLLKEEEKQKTKDNFILWKSQHPWNLQDAFAIREDNIFPTRIVKDHQTLLRQTYNPLTVKLLENGGQISHELSYDTPVLTLKINPTKDNRGVIEIDELPIDNPPWGLYYAGVDPIRQTNTVTSKSLMSVYIMKASHVDSKGRMVADFPVARYTGRFPTWEETYEVSMRLCRYYNARIAVESNVTGFHEWAIQKNYGHYFMHRKEIYLLNEWMPNSTIQNEIGIRMEGEFKKKALDFAVAYVDEIISSYEKDGEKQYIYGVSRLRDIMLMEEMLKFTAKLNTDRIVSFTLALIAARSSTNRSLVVKETSETNTNQNRSLKLPTKVSYKLPSPLTKYKGLR